MHQLADALGRWRGRLSKVGVIELPDGIRWGREGERLSRRSRGRGTRTHEFWEELRWYCFVHLMSVESGPQETHHFVILVILIVFVNGTQADQWRCALLWRLRA